MALKDVNEKLKDLTTLLLAIPALWAAIQSLPAMFRDPATAFQEHWLGYTLFAAVLLVIGLLQRDRLVRWLVPRSTLKDGDASALNIGRKYLEGRDDDVDNLLDRLADWPLVFLVGESGAGKSSLVERGLLPRLRQDPTRLAVFLDTWGADWVEGPREALARALAPLLDPPLREQLGLDGPVNPNSVMPLLGRFHDDLGITPLLLFDQFDDYQTRHRAKFLRGRRRRILKAEELVQENPFWAEVAALLAEGKVRCLITTRDDAQWGLRCVELCSASETDTYLLGRLGKSFVADLLSAVTRDVVIDPERGFDRLRERLLADLETEGWVLPVQMRVAFRSLGSLKFLTVAEYERQGALPGLEALHLKDQVGEASRIAGWQPDAVRGLLLAMVDREALKTVPCTAGRLLAATPEREPDRLDRVLKKLQDAEIIRPRIDPDKGESVWQLDHDYLSRGVLELERRAKRWPTFLAESARSFADARGFRDHWKKLLSPGQQFRLIYEWFWGRLQYGRARRYAQLSTVRLVFNIWVSLLMLSLFGWTYLEDQLKALRLFSEFGEANQTEGELKALWELSGAAPGVRRAFLDTALSHSANSRRFLVRSDAAVSAAVGLDRGLRDLLLRGLVRERCNPDHFDTAARELDVLRACSILMKDLEGPISDQVDVTLKAIELSRHNGEAYPFQEWLEGTLSSGITAEDALAIWKRLFTMALEKGSSWQVQLGRSLEGLERRLSPEAAVEAWRQVRAAMRSTAGRDEMLELPRRLESLSERFTPGDAKAAWNEVIPELQEDPKQVTGPLMALAERLPPDARAAAWHSLFSSFEVQTQSQKGLLRAYGSRLILWRLDDGFRPEDAAAAWRRAYSALTVAKGEGNREELLAVLGSLGSSLAGRDTAKAIDQVMALVRQSVNADQHINLGYVLDSLAHELEPANAKDAWNRFFPVLEGMISEKQRYGFSGLLGDLAGRLPVEGVMPAWDQVFESAMKEPDRISWGSILESLGNRLNADDSKRAWAKVLRLLERNRDLPFGGDAKLDASIVAAALRPLATRMSSTDARVEWDRLAEELKGRPVYLKGKDLSIEVMSLLAERLTPRDAGLRFSWAKEAWTPRGEEGDSKVLATLARRMPPDAVSTAFRSIPPDSDRLAPVLEILASRLPNRVADTELDVVLSVFRPLGKPTCQVAVPLLRRADDPRALELLKWPTCAAYHGRIIERIGSLAGQSFDGELWTLVSWAEHRELHPELPPVMPDFARLKVD